MTLVAVLTLTMVPELSVVRAESTGRCGLSNRQLDRVRKAARRLGASRRQARRIMRRCKRIRSIPVNVLRRDRAAKMMTSNAEGNKGCRWARYFDDDELVVVYTGIWGERLASVTTSKYFCWNKRRHRVRNPSGGGLWCDITGWGMLSSWQCDGVRDKDVHWIKWRGYRRGGHRTSGQYEIDVTVAGVGAIGQLTPSLYMDAYYTGATFATYTNKW